MRADRRNDSDGDSAAAKTRFIEPVMQHSTVSMVADRLRAAIAHGELQPGEQLREAALARESRSAADQFGKGFSG